MARRVCTLRWRFALAKVLRAAKQYSCAVHFEFEGSARRSDGCEPCFSTREAEPDRAAWTSGGGDESATRPTGRVSISLLVGGVRDVAQAPFVVSVQSSLNNHGRRICSPAVRGRIVALKS